MSVEGERKEKTLTSPSFSIEPEVPAALHFCPLPPCISESPQGGHHKQGILSHWPLSYWLWTILGWHQTVGGAQCAEFQGWSTVLPTWGSVCNDREWFLRPSWAILTPRAMQGRRKHSERVWNFFPSMSECNWRCEILCSHKLKKSRDIWINVIYYHFIGSFIKSLKDRPW